MRTVEGLVGVLKHQFFLKDQSSDWDGNYINDPWSGDALGVAPGVIGLQVPRAGGYAPVILQIYEQAPPLENDYPKIMEASITVHSGILVLSGVSDETEIALDPGTYRVRVLYADLDTCTYDDDDGAEHYVVQIFPGDDADSAVIKPWGNCDDPVREYQGTESPESLLLTVQQGPLSASCSAVVNLARLGESATVLDLAHTHSSQILRMVATGALGLVGAKDALKELAQSQDTAVKKIATDAFKRVRRQAKALTYQNS